MSFAKFSRTPFFTEHLQWLLLKSLVIQRFSVKEVLEIFFDRLQVHNNTGEKVFAKYLSADGCLITVMITTMLFSDTRTFAFPSSR